MNAQFFNIKFVTEIFSDQKTTIETKQSWWLDHYRSYSCSSYFPKSFKVWFQSVSENNCLFTNGYYFTDSADTAKIMVIEGLDLIVSLRQLLFKWDCECVPPLKNVFGSLQEIERLESAWGMESLLRLLILPLQILRLLLLRIQ